MISVGILTLILGLYGITSHYNTKTQISKAKIAKNACQVVMKHPAQPVVARCPKKQKRRNSDSHAPRLISFMFPLPSKCNVYVPRMFCRQKPLSSHPVPVVVG